MINPQAKINQFLKHVSPEHRGTVSMIRRLMREVAPEAKEVIMYGSLGWKNKGIIAVINPTKKYVSFVFTRGAELEDEYGLLEGGGKIRKLIRIKNTGVNADALRHYIKQAVKLDKK